MVSKAYSWLATGGGAWSLSSNWDDLTDGIDPSLTVPGPTDNVTVAGATGTGATSITGSGAVLNAALLGAILLEGEFAFGGFSLGADGNGGLLTVGTGDTVQAGNGTIATGSAIASGVGALIEVTGLATLGEGQTGYGASACNLDATNAGRVLLGSLLLNASSAAIYVDPSSIVEVGQAGGAATGALTIDPGATLSGQGDANAYGSVINNGTVDATGGELLLGATGGVGQLLIQNGAVLALNGATGAGQSVTFAGAQATLAIATEFDQPSGAISGFVPGDAIDMLGSPISEALYTGIGQDQGVLTLFYGSQIADTLTLLGTYAGDVFLTGPDGAGGTLITVAPETGGSGNPSSGTASPDQYLWIAPGSGPWKLNTAWEDVTTGANPSRIAPGANNLVTFACSLIGSFTVVAGPANAAALSVTGDLAMAGTYAIGALTMGIGGDDMVGGVLDLLPGCAMTADSAAIQDGDITATGGAVLTVAGLLALGGGPSGIGLPVTALSATSGGTITCGTLTLGGGSGNTITTDPTGVVRIGVGTAAVGAVTIEAGASLSGNGDVNPFGAIVDNGSVTASGGDLALGTVTGSGSLALIDSAVLTLDATTALPVFFGDASSILAVADELIAATGLISGFVSGDAIDIDNDPITAVTSRISGSNTILTLYYGSTPVSNFTLAGNYTGYRFIVVPDGSNGTDVLVEHGNNGGGGGGQGTNDLLGWANPVTGAWYKAANWFDITTNAAATAAPGTLNPVQIVGPQGNGFQTVAGPGVCATISFFGNTALNGAFSTGALTVGGTPVGSTTLTPGAVDIVPASGLAGTSATVADGIIIVGGTAATLAVSGTLTLGGGGPDEDGPSALVAAEGGGLVQAAALAMGGGSGDTLQADIISSIEIGTLGHAALGAVTIDTGIAAAANGAVNLGGAVIVNGTLTALGGTLIVGNTTGAGMLAIGAAATLELSGAEACPINMVGAGASLLLAGSSEDPAGVIADFVPGDMIITGSSQVGSIAYAPGSGGVGTLTLYSGSQVAGTLLLAGDFSGETFVVAPDGDGSAISLQGNSGPPNGTTSPDHYLWIGGPSGAWANAANWQDVTAGQNPAALAPGVNDIDTIQGGASAYITVTGPANAALLTLLGEVALTGQFATGMLAVGQGRSTGVFAIGAGTAVQAAQANVDGGLVAQGGALLCTGTLTLQTGVLVASLQAALSAGAIVLAGTGDAISVDASSQLEVGGSGTAQAGQIDVDPGAVLAGAGVLSAQGGIVDQGTITALDTGTGTLSLGNVSGAGTLLVGAGATMLLQSAAAASLLVDFAGPGTLSIAGTIPQAAIAGFGEGDAILVQIGGIDNAVYTQTAPNVGVLILYAGDTAEAEMTLVGVGLGQSFSVAGAAGGTIITTQPTDYGGGGSTMRGADSSGGGQIGVIDGFDFWQDLPAVVQSQLAAFQENVGGTSYVYTSPDGTYFGPYDPGFANFAVVSAPDPYTTVALPPGYQALLAQGNLPVRLDDGAGNHDLLMGNAANNTIIGFGGDDTLVGGANGNTVIFAQKQDTVYGGGNDTIITGQAPCSITTASSGRSVVFAEAASHIIDLNGADTLVAAAGPGANETVLASGSDTVFAPAVGQLTFHGGSGADIVVGTGGTVYMVGGAGNGSSLWCGNCALAEYVGGGGSALVVGGTGDLSVQGGAGALTVFGGSGPTIIDGAAGPSRFLVGYGESTVTAASGNLVWLVGAANDSLVASGGNVTMWGANSAGDNVFQAGSGYCWISGGIGNDTIIGGGGSALLSGGGGANTYSFTNGLAGGAVSITDFHPALDQIDLHGYGSYSSAVVNGNEVLSLTDGTTITLDHVGSLMGVVINQG